MPKIFIANVGVNASHSLKSPIFDDGTFEFIPIPEEEDLSGCSIQTYSDLCSFNDPDRLLTEYIPPQYLARPAHNDPEFLSFTYGDNCRTTARAAGLRSIGIGDFLLFYARMTSYESRRFTKKAGFYFIGMIEVSLIASDLMAKPDYEILSAIGNNAHVRRALSDDKFWNGFWVFKGSERSSRFRIAVPLTRRLAERAFLTRSGMPWNWRARKTHSQTIGSYLRSCRCCFDTAVAAESERALILVNEIDTHNPGTNTSQFLALSD